MGDGSKVCTRENVGEPSFAGMVLAKTQLGKEGRKGKRATLSASVNTEGSCFHPNTGKQGWGKTKGGKLVVQGMEEKVVSKVKKGKMIGLGLWTTSQSSKISCFLWNMRSGKILVKLEGVERK